MQKLLVTAAPHLHDQTTTQKLMGRVCLACAPAALAACLIFGSGFAFYAMFAAIAVELIGAVYYTFQLK